MQISSQISGFAQATSSGYKTLAAIPGKTIIHRGKSFKNEAIMQPPLAWIIVLAANVLWTITWSEHQYQIEETESPNTKEDISYPVRVERNFFLSIVNFYEISST